MEKQGVEIIFTDNKLGAMLISSLCLQHKILPECNRVNITLHLGGQQSLLLIPELTIFWRLKPNNLSVSLEV